VSRSGVEHHCRLFEPLNLCTRQMHEVLGPNERHRDNCAERDEDHADDEYQAQARDERHPRDRGGTAWPCAAATAARTPAEDTILPRAAA